MYNVLQNESIVTLRP